MDIPRFVTTGAHGKVFGDETKRTAWVRLWLNVPWCSSCKNWNYFTIGRDAILLFFVFLFFVENQQPVTNECDGTSILILNLTCSSLKQVLFLLFFVFTFNVQTWRNIYICSCWCISKCLSNINKLPNNRYSHSFSVLFFFFLNTSTLIYDWNVSCAETG